MVHVFPGRDYGWFVRIVAFNGETMLVSESYTRKSSARRRTRDPGGPKLTPVRTGFDLHEGSAILAARRAERERCEAVDGRRVA